MGKLVVIEGLDGSGKSTQLALLPQNLAAVGIACKTVSFPDYDDPSSTLVKMYLGGEFGQNAGDVNAHAATLFYTVDRYASFRRHWEAEYTAGGLIVAGRYTTSNAVHQTAKLPPEEWETYLDWLYDLEYQKIGIPRPDAVIFLDMPPEVSGKLLSVRYGGDEQKKDIHERDTAYLQNCRKAALFAAKHGNWKVISCAKDGEARSIDDIAADILNAVLEVL